jgi:hypothetical protein
MDLDVLTAALDDLDRSDPAALADPESVVVLQRQLARLEAMVTESTAAFDATGAWGLDGARSAAAWLTTRCHLAGSQARRQVRRGRELRHLGVCARTWRDGELTGAQVDVVIGLRNPVTADALARDEAMLCDQARTLRYDSFVRAAAYWEQLADPDGTEDHAERCRGRRDVYLANTYNGMWLGAMTLDAISGAIVADELERLEHQLFDADWAEARTALGRDPHPSELLRTPAQRRADALVEMATRSKTAPRDGRRPAPLFTVLVGYETLHGRLCQLPDATVVPPGALLRWMDGADLERAVFAPPRRVEISARTRLFTGATRRAIEVRDLECTHPYCDVPAPSCQVDHVQPFAVGGPTTQENGRLLCPTHNRQRTQRPPPRE